MTETRADAGAGTLRPDDPVARGVRGWLGAGYVPADAPLVVACSGGADSLALALAVRAVVRDRKLCAATVDHGLQPGLAEVARTTADTLRDLGYTRAEVLPVTVSGPGGMEAAARDARFAALRELAASIAPDAAVLLAHTADDQAETVLLGLARGSGPRSIAGMSPWRAPWGRPLLGVRRADTVAACAAAGLTPWQDPQNADPAFTRVRLRREVLPLLERVLGGGIAPALARTAELMADDLAALDELADRALAAAERPGSAGGTGPTDEAGPGDEPGSLRCAELARWPGAIRRRALRSWIARQAGVTELTYQHLMRLDDLVTARRSGSAVRLPTGVDAVRRGPDLILVRAAPAR